MMRDSISSSKKTIKCNTKCNSKCKRILSDLDKLTCKGTSCSRQFSRIQVAMDIVAKDCFLTNIASLGSCNAIKDLPSFSCC